MSSALPLPCLKSSIFFIASTSLNLSTFGGGTLTTGPFAPPLKNTAPAAKIAVAAPAIAAGAPDGPDAANLRDLAAEAADSACFLAFSVHI